MKKSINIVNFVRAVEPRWEADLVKPVVKQIELLKKYGFPNTFLLQYDTMADEKFRNIFLNEQDENMEIGIWLEIVKPLCEAVNIEWRGRAGFDWDYHVNPGFLQAYSRQEKELLIDEVFNMFRNIFGYYPKSAGSWLLDSYSMQYMSEKYNLEAFCICRDQWGTDGYTIWGGYYNQGYYPCMKNMLHPAQTEEEQIRTPVFRMLGSDPIYQYDDGFEKNSYNMVKWQDVLTLEPAMKLGQKKEWVEWYFKNFVKNEDLGFSNVQVGQENSFGWEQTEKGLPMQFDIIEKLAVNKEVVIEKLCDTGKWFKATYLETPSTVCSALTDWKNEDRKSIWFNSKNYRANLFSEENSIWFRDIHLFDENYVDRYLESPCMEDGALYETLPVMDGYKWSKDTVRAGIYFEGNFKIDNVYKENNNLIASILSYDGVECKVEFLQGEIKVMSNKDVKLKFIFNSDIEGLKLLKYNNEIRYNFKGYDYKVIIQEGKLEENDGSICISDTNGSILMNFCVR